MRPPPVSFAVTLVVLLCTPATALSQEEVPRDAQGQDTGWDPFMLDVDDFDRLEELRGTYEVRVGGEGFELAHITLALTPYAERTVREDAYAKDVEAWFGEHRDHPLIQSLAAREPDNYFFYNTYRLNSFIYCFDRPYIFFRSCEPLSHIHGRVANQFTQHADMLVDFVWDADYLAFLREQEAYYERVRADFEERVPFRDMWAWLEERYPNRVDRYEILIPGIGFGVHSTNRVRYGDVLVAYLFLESVSHLAPEESYRAHRMTFTEIDHNYDREITFSEPFRERLGSEDSFGSPYWVDDVQGTRSYPGGPLVFAEYMTWAVYELWAHDRHDAATFALAREDATEIMLQRGFRRYRAFADELLRLYREQDGEPDLTALYEPMIAWGEARVAGGEADAE